MSDRQCSRPALPAEMPTRIPDFFIVGAPKCGTTALYTYLRPHPDIFMPDLKELNFFCTDLVPSVIPDMLTYLALFATSSGRMRCTSGCVGCMR